MKYTHVVYSDNMTPDFCASLEEAAIEKLSHDGHEWDIRPAEDGDGWKLWGSQFSRNSPAGGKPLGKTSIYSLNADEESARHEIFQKVADAGWRGYPDICTRAAWENSEDGVTTTPDAE